VGAIASFLLCGCGWLWAFGQHARVAQWVLDNLVNVGSTDRGFRALYGTFGVPGAYERRVFDFKLLIELVSAEGEIYLRASDEAINVLVGALDTDVESAQIAAEAGRPRPPAETRAEIERALTGG